MIDLIVKNTYNKIIDGNLIIPEFIKQIKIDVGLAGEAPNSALWLSETNDRFVIGIEPLKYHWNLINKFETANAKRPYPTGFPILQIEDNVIKYDGQVISEIGERFCGLECAIDNTNIISERKFYQINRNGGSSGASSLLRPNINHPQGEDIEDEPIVKTISLEQIINTLPIEKFGFIEHIKTDCEGYDFEVVKSIGKYLKNIVFISSELLRRNLWDNKPSDEEFINFMTENDFSVISESGGEIHFVNNNLKDKIQEHNLNNKTLGL